MVYSIISIAMTCIALAFSGGMVAYVAKPRLPQYTFAIQQFPRLVRSNTHQESFFPTFQTKIGANIALTNDNFVSIEVHSMSINLYYPSWSGQSLGRMAHIEDAHQQEKSQAKEMEKQVAVEESKARTLEYEISKRAPIIDDESALEYFRNKEQQRINKVVERKSKREERKLAKLLEQKQSQERKLQQEELGMNQLEVLNAIPKGEDISFTVDSVVKANSPLWTIPARSRFSTYDHVLVDNQLGLTALPRVLYDLIFENGFRYLRVPSSGVLHVKALGAPVTLGIVCDNMFLIWTLTMEGYSCQLAGVPQLGWSDHETHFGRIEKVAFDGQISV